MATRAENVTFDNTDSKTIAKNSLFLYIRMGAIMALSLLGVRFLLQALGIENYGVYNAIGGVVTSFTFISNVLASASQRFFSFAIGQNDAEQLKRSFSTVILVFLAITGIVLIVAEAVGEWFICTQLDPGTVNSSTIQVIYQFSLLTFIFTLLTTPLVAMIISHEQMRYYSVISICDGVLKLAVIIVLFLLPQEDMRTEYYAVFLCAVSILTFVLYLLTVLRKFPYLTIMPKWCKSLFREVFSFSGWSCLGSLAGVLYQQGMNLLLNVFIGPLANAAFTVANQVNIATTSFGLSFFMAVRPALIKSYAANDEGRLRDLYIFSSKSTFALLFLFLVPLYLQAPAILQLWLGEVTEYMVPFVRILLIGSLIMSLGMPVTAIVDASGKVKLYHILVDGFIAISILVVYWFLRQGLSPVLAMSVSIPTYLTAHFLRLYVLKLECGIPVKPYLVSFMLPAIVVTFLSVALNGCLEHFVKLSMITELCVVTLSSIIINLILIYLLLLNSGERSRIKDLIITRQK